VAKRRAARRRRAEVEVAAGDGVERAVVQPEVHVLERHVLDDALLRPVDEDPDSPVATMWLNFSP